MLAFILSYAAAVRKSRVMNGLADFGEMGVFY